MRNESKFPALGRAAVLRSLFQFGRRSSAARPLVSSQQRLSIRIRCVAGRIQQPVQRIIRAAQREQPAGDVVQRQTRRLKPLGQRAEDVRQFVALRQTMIAGHAVMRPPQRRITSFKIRKTSALRAFADAIWNRLPERNGE